METLGRNDYLVEHFQVVAESPINRESRRHKLESDGVLSPRAVPDEKEILTLTVATKASFHELPANFNFAHPLRSGVGDGEWRVVSSLLSGAVRHCWAKSAMKLRMYGRGTSKNMTHQKARW